MADEKMADARTKVCTSRRSEDFEQLRNQNRISESMQRLYP